MLISQPVTQPLLKEPAYFSRSQELPFSYFLNLRVSSHYKYSIPFALPPPLHHSKGVSHLPPHVLISTYSSDLKEYAWA